MHFVIAFDDKVKKDISKKLNTVLVLYLSKKVTINKRKTVLQIIHSFFKRKQINEYVKDSTYQERISVLKKKYSSKLK